VPKRAFGLLFCAVLFVTTSFAASKKSERHRNWSEDQSDLSLQSGGLLDDGSSVSGGVGDLKLSQGGGPGGVLTLPPGVPDNWNGGAGNWSNAGDWSAGEPGATSDVTVYSGGNDLVTLDVSTTISSLTLGGLSNGTTSGITDIGLPQTLTITNALNVGATGYISFTGGSTITAGADSSNAGQIDLENKSALDVTGNFSNSGLLATNLMLFGGGNTINISGMLTNSGTFELLGLGDMASIGNGMTNAGTVDVENGSTLTITGNVTISGTGILGTDLNGFGGGNTINISGTLNNSGLFSAFDIMGSGDKATVGGTFTNSGAVGISGTGTEVTVGGLTNNGSGEIEVFGGSRLQVNGDAINAGMIQTGLFGTGNIVNITGMLTNSGTFELMGMGDQGTIGNGLSNTGTVEVFNGSSLTITAGGVSNASGSTIDVENGSTLSINGDVTNNGILATDFNSMGGGNALNINGTVTNSGTFELLGSGDMATLGGLTNSVGGLVDLENGSTLVVNGSADNSWELFTSSNGGSGHNTVNITGTLTNEGTGQFILYGPGDMAALGSLSNAGFVDLENGSTLQVTGDVNNSGSLFTSFILASGGNTINITGSLTNSGGFALFGPGDTATIGSLTNNVGALVDVEGGSTLTISGDADNSGQFFTSFTLTGGNTVSIGDSLTNEVGGEFVLNGPGDMGTIGNGVSNSGTVDVFNGSTLTVTAGGATNSGLLDVENGSTMNITGDVTNNGTMETGESSGGNTLSITGNLTNSGEFGLFGAGDMGSISGNVTNSGEFFSAFGATATIGGNLDNSGLFDAEAGGTLIVGGDVTNSGALGTDFFGAGGNDTITINGSLTNNAMALVDVEGGSTLTIKGDVNNASGVPFSMNEEGIFTSYNGSGGNTININGTLTNSGVFELLGPGDMATIGGGMGTVVNNSGLIDLENGSTLQINGDVTNSFIIETAGLGGGGGNTLNITGTLTNQGMDGLGLFGAGDMATIGGDLVSSAIVTVEHGSTLTVGGNVTNSGVLATDFFGNGGGNTLTVQGTVTNSGTFELLGSGDMATLGGLTNSMGGLVDLENGSKLVVNGNADNAWELFTSSMAGSGFNTIAIDGTLTNESTGQVILFGSHDLAELLSLNNAGLVDLEGGPDSGMLVIGDVNNSGSILTSFITGSGGNTLEIGGNLNNSGGVGLFGPGDTALVLGNVTNAAGAMIDVENGSTLNVGGNVDNSGQFFTDFSGGGGGNTVTIGGTLTNEATGIVTLNGPGDVLQALAGLTNSGVINVNNGSSILPPFFNNLGTLNIDGTSRFVVGTPNPMGGQGYIQLANGTLGEMIASLSSFGVINVNGSALLDGTLAILLQGGYNPAVGSMFKFLNFTSGDLSGMFANIENDIFNGGTEKWVVTYDNADGFVELTAEPNQVPEPAILLVLIPGLLGMGYGLRRKLLQ
jgi:fibronectin-binding autotransporter adhesin